LAWPRRPVERPGTSSWNRPVRPLCWRVLARFVILLLGTGLYPALRERHRRPK
jgi:hypothetical protein